VVKIAKLKLSEHLQIGKQEKRMPAFYKIDKRRRLVLSSAYGVFSRAAL